MDEKEQILQMQLLADNASKIEAFCRSLLVKNAELKKEIVNLNSELNIKSKRLSEVEKKYNDLKLAQAFGGQSADGNKEAKQKINKIIREIENCITLLKK
ncbi:MAG: hypothetical protein HUK15_06800 [Bacteroidales bacterium]|nr:hypothetical protein [Bacteroidales bacterium]